MLLHFGFVTFRFHYGRTRKPVIFMIFGFWDASTTPKTNIIYLWRHQDTSTNTRKIPNPFRKYYCQKYQKLGTRNCWKLWKRWGSNKTEDSFNTFWNSWMWDQHVPEDVNGILWKSWIWEQYLSKSMKWKFSSEYGINIFKRKWNWNLVLSMGSIFSKKIELQ